MRRKVIDEGDDDGDVEVKEYEEEQGVERISRDADGQGEGEGEKQNATSGEQAASVSPRDLQVAATFMAGRYVCHFHHLFPSFIPIHGSVCFFLLSSLDFIVPFLSSLSLPPSSSSMR